MAENFKICTKDELMNMSDNQKSFEKEVLMKFPNKNDMDQIRSVLEQSQKKKLDKEMINLLSEDEECQNK